MLGITTMKLYQEWSASPIPETQALVEKNKELLIVGMSATGRLLHLYSLLVLIFPSFLSFVALESEQEEAFNYGMHFFCPKPVSLELLTIVLAAKREFDSNDDAVDRICSTINSNGDEKGGNSTDNAGSASFDNSTAQPNNLVANSGNVREGEKNVGYRSREISLKGDIVAVEASSPIAHHGSNIIGGGINSANNSIKDGGPATGGKSGGEDKNKWILFRKKTGKIHPDGTIGNNSNMNNSDNNNSVNNEHPSQQG
jgi:hypothetical protein